MLGCRVQSGGRRPTLQHSSQEPISKLCRATGSNKQPQHVLQQQTFCWSFRWQSHRSLRGRLQPFTRVMLLGSACQ